MAKSLEQILDDLVATLSPKIRDAFQAAIQGVDDQVILADLIAAIQAGDYEAAFQTLGMSKASLRPITAALQTIFEQGGVAVGSTFPKILNTKAGRAVFRFDVTNPNAEQWLKDQSSTLVTRIQEDARVNVRNVMTRGLEAGNNPRVTALDIVGRVVPATGQRVGGIIGLSQPQELWVANARRDLTTLNPTYFTRTRRDKRFDSIVRKAMDSNTPLDQTTVDKLIVRYKSSLLQLRGETIARTETIQSLNRSQHEALTQAVHMGAVKQKDIKREWDTAGDDRVRDTHAEMEGQTVGLDEPFTTPDGYSLMFPGDTSLGADAAETINCRCRVKMKIDWLANID
jgi:hypothetical protein